MLLEAGRILTIVSMLAATPSAAVPSNTLRPLCSLVPIPGLKLAGAPYFLGRATSDTVLAGPGQTEARAGNGHYGKSANRVIYGQLIAVDQSGGSEMPPGISQADTVVVVAWDYDSMCAPVPWSGSSRWLPPGPVRFFYPRLRDRAHWVGQMPTYDAFQPGLDAFPSFPTDAPPLQTGIPPGRNTQVLVSPESLFAFYEALPTLPESGDVTPEAFAQLRDWSERHPALAYASPIADVLHTMAWDATETRARNSAVSMAGTYRLTITFPNAASRTLFLRTADRPDRYGFHSQVGPDIDRPADPLEIRSLGFEVPFWIAVTESELPTTERHEGRSSWGWRIAWPDSLRASGEWPAEIDPWEFFPKWKDEDPAVDAFVDAHGVWFDAEWEAKSLPVWLGAFIGAKHEHFRQEVPGGALRPMVIEAVRVGNETVKPARNAD